jgi:predicted RNA binding protein YcfA (HicA-like mRNA interferase family)
VKARELRKLLKGLGCVEVRQNGSHLLIKCGDRCITTIPVHAGEDIKTGTLKAIEKQLEACLGKGWLGR